ncbi:hypothetical protein DAPPUDRAFT_236253 [Daphnia pulex]|uniref:Uncharacterized protein n=1 Tax=Daphnia pulex TaxID=6669 RepID=E9G1L2_DAPPU|nr:hypothetical protein DAPPUDRAFT_236253 [Daphnia pulex]|eukprot:EFX86515.1 hypothetical protein DAPPUDRAFT_236253 [Daphnia pulex]
MDSFAPSTAAFVKLFGSRFQSATAWDSACDTTGKINVTWLMRIIVAYNDWTCLWGSNMIAISIGVIRSVLGVTLLENLLILWNNKILDIEQREGGWRISVFRMY